MQAHEPVAAVGAGPQHHVGGAGGGKPGGQVGGTHFGQVAAHEQAGVRPAAELAGQSLLHAGAQPRPALLARAEAAGARARVGVFQARDEGVAHGFAFGRAPPLVAVVHRQVGGHLGDMARAVAGHLPLQAGAGVGRKRRREPRFHGARHGHAREEDDDGSTAHERPFRTSA